MSPTELPDLLRAAVARLAPVIPLGQELGKRFADINTAPIGEGDATPEALRAKLLSEIDRWAPIIKEAGQYAD